MKKDGQNLPGVFREVLMIVTSWQKVNVIFKTRS